MEAWEYSRNKELERSAQDDMDDLWDEQLKAATTGNYKLRDEQVKDLRTLRDEYADARKAREHADKWEAHRYFLAEGIDPPEYQPGQEPQGHDPAAGDSAVIVLPSAGPAFDPPKRPMAAFLVDVRQDMVVPMRRPTMVPRGLRNSGNLCYRNAVVTALLNTPRFLSFLFTHGRNVRSYLGCPDVNHHLLTRLYHLALAYWERGGLHPMSLSDAVWDDDNPNPNPNAPTAGDKRRRDGSAASGGDSYEKLLALFWRACKYDLGGHDLGGVTVEPAPSKYPGVTLNWRAHLQQLRDDEAANQHHPNPASVEVTSHQQDAAEYLNWLVEMAATQLDSAPRRYSASRASDYYDCMFRTYITDRFLCTLCKRPVRLRGPSIERAPSIMINVAKEGDTAAPPGLASRPRRLGGRDGLKKLLHDHFNDDVGGNTCNRCGQQPKIFRRMRRMQTAPELLNIHLARTGWDANLARPFKSNSIVDAPEFLDVSRYLEPHIFAPGTRVLYRLASVVSHAGESAHSGHYVSYVRDDRATPARPAKPILEADEVDRVMREATERKKLVARESHTLAETIRNENAAVGSKNQLSADRREANSERFLAIERYDSAWARINDTCVVPGIPYTRILNTSRDPMYHPKNGKGDWFDPVLLVYEKWVEKYAVDTNTGKRLYQLPLNVPNAELYMGPTRGKAKDPHNRPPENPGVDEILWEDNATKDVRIPERGPPRRVIGVPHGVFQGVKENILYVDRDEDGQRGDGTTAEQSETFFGWSTSDGQSSAAVATAAAAGLAAPGTAPGTASGVASGAAPGASTAVAPTATGTEAAAGTSTAAPTAAAPTTATPATAPTTAPAIAPATGAATGTGAAGGGDGSNLPLPGGADTGSPGGMAARRSPPSKRRRLSEMVRGMFG